MAQHFDSKRARAHSTKCSSTKALADVKIQKKQPKAEAVRETDETKGMLASLCLDVNQIMVILEFFI